MHVAQSWPDLRNPQWLSHQGAERHLALFVIDQSMQKSCANDDPKAVSLSPDFVEP